MKKPSGPRGTEGQRAEEVGWFAGSDALMKYEDSGHAPTVLPGTVSCQPADTLVSASGWLSRGPDASADVHPGLEGVPLVLEPGGLLVEPVHEVGQLRPRRLALLRQPFELEDLPVAQHRHDDLVAV
jgi:hypothetical protein